jgi:hypothetical protein
MAWFDVGAGLAKVGEAVGQVATVAVIDAQRAELEKQRLQLADELARGRDSEQRAFVSGEREKTQAFQGGESEKDRAFRASEGEKNRASEERRTGMSTGATLTAAQMQINFRREELDKTLAANREAATKLQIGEDGVAYAVNPISQKVEPLKLDGQPLKFRDPDQAKAQTEMIRTYSTQLTDLSRAYVPQITALEATVRKLQTDDMTSVDPQAKKDLERSQAELKALRERYEQERLPLVNKLNQIGSQLGAKAKIGGASSSGPSGLPPITDFIRKPKGLIDTPPQD